MKPTSAWITWHTFSNQGGGWSCVLFMVPCGTRSVLVSVFEFFCCFGTLFLCVLTGSSTEMTFLSKCTNIRCVTCVSMRLDLPGHFVLWFHGTRRLTLSPTSYTGRARSSIEKKTQSGVELALDPRTLGAYSQAETHFQKVARVRPTQKAEYVRGDSSSSWTFVPLEKAKLNPPPSPKNRGLQKRKAK